MNPEERLEHILRAAKKDAKKHGGAKERALHINKTVDTVDMFIDSLHYASFIVLKAFKEGEPCDCIVLHTTKELSEQLTDTPENEKTWDRIYKSIPPCILIRTSRIIPKEGTPNDDDYAMVVYCDLTSKEGKNLANRLIEKWEI